MKEYWPMAEIKEETPSVFGNKLFTYDSCTTLEKAQKQFYIWANHHRYHIKKAWIEITENGQKVDEILYDEN